MPRVLITYFDAGGGHRSAARSLVAILRRERPAWSVETLNLDAVLESADPLHLVTGIRGGQVYNWALRRGWTYGHATALPAIHASIRMFHSRQVRLLQRCWRDLRPDLVVSVVPHFNRALFESLAIEAPGTPFATILTDFADYPPHFWVEPQAQHVICGSEIAVHQATTFGRGRASVWRVSGMMVHPHFYELDHVDREEERCRLGLDPRLATGVLLFGGYGADAMIDVVREIDRSGLMVQLICLCGRNSRLSRRISRMRFNLRIHVQGYTEHVAGYLSLADFFVGKPGPGSVSEALAAGLPVIVQESRATVAQERYNVHWIRQNGVGLSYRRRSEIVPAVRTVLDPTIRAAILQRIQTLENRAVFEVVGILEQIVEGRAQAAS